jgi:hypothetical protein
MRGHTPVEFLIVARRLVPAMPQIVVDRLFGGAMSDGPALPRTGDRRERAAFYQLYRAPPDRAIVSTRETRR